MESKDAARTVGTSRLAMFLLGATLAMGFAFSAYMLSTALVKMRQESLIHVKGLSEANVTSNFASWSCNFWCRSEQLQGGYADLEKSRNAIVAFLKAANVTDAEMSVNPASIGIRYKLDEKGNKTNTIEGYELNQSISAWSKDVSKIGSVAKNISELIKNGIELHSNSPSFVYTDIESVKLDLLGKATKNAYERAQAMANNSNGKVGTLCSASQGVFQITPVNSTDVSDSGCYDTSSIEKTVKCVVTLDFQVKK